MATISAQSPGVPTARLVAAPRFELPARIDSSNPAVWSLVGGVQQLFVISSWGGIPVRSIGPSLDSLHNDGPVAFASHPGHGVWFEAIIPGEADTWYAYYHHERPADLCGRPDRQLPRIGAMRSTDRGATWEDLGIVLDAPAESAACESSNRFVLGGVGDVTAALDPDTRDIYLYFSQYSRDAAIQGVAVARLAWADRDEPMGKVSIWNDGAWLADGHGTPLVRARQPFHDRSSNADVFWGPSIHWNTYLERYVMLLNRARDDQFTNDGIYVSYSPTLADPSQWTAPVKIMNGGGWYPQVIGGETGIGTDRIAGKRARFFLTGRSERYIEFER
ncbi:MAG TPA: hypothetical protein VJ691_19350 [Vicinamibacterales bacterium]|nr:hypothetical protein [Vicinamibacterales bacterium]